MQCSIRQNKISQQALVPIKPRFLLSILFFIKHSLSFRHWTQSNLRSHPTLNTSQDTLLKSYNLHSKDMSFESPSPPTPPPILPSFKELLLEPRHKAIAINIMFFANRAAYKFTTQEDGSTSTQVGDVHNRDEILRLAPGAVTDVFHVAHGVEIPSDSVTRYYLEIQESAKTLSIKWEEEAVAELIATIIASGTDKQKEIERLFIEVANICKYYINVSPKGQALLTL